MMDDVKLLTTEIRLMIEVLSEENKRLQAENKRLREALEDIADGTRGTPPQNYQEAARFWQSRHDLFAGIAQECLAEACNDIQLADEVTTPATETKE